MRVEVREQLLQPSLKTSQRIKLANKRSLYYHYRHYYVYVKHMIRRCVHSTQHLGKRGRLYIVDNKPYPSFVLYTAPTLNTAYFSVLRLRQLNILSIVTVDNHMCVRELVNV